MFQKGRIITFIDRNNLCVMMILKNIAKWPPLTSEEEYELWRRMRQATTMLAHASSCRTWATS